MCSHWILLDHTPHETAWRLTVPGAASGRSAKAFNINFSHILRVCQLIWQSLAATCWTERQEKSVGGDHLPLLLHCHSVHPNHTLISQFIPDLNLRHVSEVPTPDYSQRGVRGLVNWDLDWSVNKSVCLEQVLGRGPFATPHQEGAISQSIDVLRSGFSWKAFWIAKGDNFCRGRSSFAESTIKNLAQFFSLFMSISLSESISESSSRTLFFDWCFVAVVC